MASRGTARSVSQIVLGAAVVSFVVYTARAEGDDHVGEIVAQAEPAFSDEMPDKPDIILITIDTLRADRIGVYGYASARTPNMDALGDAGVIFANATVPLPRTTPGLASLLTGLSPEQHGSREVWQRLDVDKGSRLAEVLSNAGYVTLGLSANSAAGSKQGLAVGFDKFLDYKVIKKKRKRDDADVMTDEALEMLQKVDADAPVFLWVHYVDPHWRYNPSKKRYPDQPKGPRCRAMQKQIKAHELSLGNLISNANGIAADIFDECSALYDAEIGFVDQEVGRLVEGLQDLGRWDDSLVVLTSDHGENMGEDGMFFAHGPSLADGSLRVPLIMAGPTIPSGRYDGGVAIIEDVMPTLLELIGIAPEDRPENMEGQSLQWRWNPDLDYPERVRSAALSEAGGALNADNVNFLVSGRERSRYCYNGPRYSMCFEPNKRKTVGTAVRVRPPVRVPDDHVEDEHEAEHTVQDGAPAPVLAREPAHPSAAAPASRTVAKSGTDDASEPEILFFDRKKDPKLIQPLETIPDQAREELLTARDRWSPESTRARAVRTAEYKLVAYPEIKGDYRYALYDLKADPMEANDVSALRPKDFKRMKKMFDEYESTMTSFVARERSASEIEAMQGLGYTQ
ncbi:MAG: sulfatase-like hydrolase/transferase [Nannocystaceae bacterium]|nr:sulfatase-like hydrolase/transferase [Nannocystaceae bacterium]